MSSNPPQGALRPPYNILLQCERMTSKRKSSRSNGGQMLFMFIECEAGHASALTDAAAFLPATRFSRATSFLCDWDVMRCNATFMLLTTAKITLNNVSSEEVSM
mmetsp:Transcript_31769/g.58217  ORF Transcript_31769/g.58217 Transcript_31769/m.58217 type:complete len:104 (+) Transcript_31769:426-737(+)